MQLKVGDQFSGWYEAPMSLGKTEFLLEVEKVGEVQEAEKVEKVEEESEEMEGYAWTGRGKDLTTLSNLGQRLNQEREFTCDGLIKDREITFTKNFCDGSHTGIKYKGVLKEEEGSVVVEGEYKTQFSKLFIKMDIQEKFSMTITP